MLRALLVGLLALVGFGCGGPYLIVKTDRPARVFVRPVQDGRGVELEPKPAEIELGDAPAEWEVPPGLLGGRAYVRAVFAEGESDAWVGLPKTEDSDDHEVRVLHPRGL